MVDHPNCTWTGASGKMYVYAVHRRHPEVTPNEPGNFIYARMDEERRWVPIYVGQGNLTQRALAETDRLACIDAKGATHVHLHGNYDQDDRVAEQQDLLDNYPQAYAPEGCNEEPSG